ncbi:endonuclease/exonuclease/phosphatase family protein [Ruania halotolerans]|uniref:endonuclease/exonuclease/phosphatase family protein n=1 Tax=Ruania halotolerans TaxID=2897773 RepID=UPI001E39AD2C|nr:endonuclease/exonuclease/phosphatase family protein [Ruania halotolerans]UFU04872.1 endonuclease/exonuclease/phosphatase family protein [Ruania halotolerans]
MAEPSTTRVMTYNIKYDAAEADLTAWTHRRAAVVAQIRHTNPDILGLQEVLAHQLTDLRHDLPGYAAVGVGREDGARNGEFVPLLIRRAAWHIRAWGTFWLSETPGVPSRAPDTRLPRICTWARLRPHTRTAAHPGLTLWNVHLDHQQESAQTSGIRTVLDHLEQVPGPHVLMGDLNAGPGSPALTLAESVLQNARSTTQTSPVGPGATFHDWSPGRVTGSDGDDPRRIDHVLASGELAVRRYEAPVPTYPVVPSDHLPVVVDLALGGG